MRAYWGEEHTLSSDLCPSLPLNRPTSFILIQRLWINFQARSATTKGFWSLWWSQQGWPYGHTPGSQFFTSGRYDKSNMGTDTHLHTEFSQASKTCTFSTEVFSQWLESATSLLLQPPLPPNVSHLMSPAESWPWSLEALWGGHLPEVSRWLTFPPLVPQDSSTPWYIERRQVSPTKQWLVLNFE